MGSCVLRLLLYYTSLAAQRTMSQCVGPKMSHNSVSGLVALKKTQKEQSSQIVKPFAINGLVLDVSVSDGVIKWPLSLVQQLNKELQASFSHLGTSFQNVTARFEMTPVSNDKTQIPGNGRRTNDVSIRSPEGFLEGSFYLGWKQKSEIWSMGDNNKLCKGQTEFECQKRFKRRLDGLFFLCLCYQNSSEPMLTVVSLLLFFCPGFLCCLWGVC